MNFKELKERINKISNSIIQNNREMFEEIGKMAAIQIQKRTRTGKGVSKDGKQEKLAELKESTIKARKRKNLHSETSPKKSNLTESGETIDAITYKASPNNVKIEFTSGDAKQKAKWAHDGSSNRKKRRFFDLTENEQKKISKWVKNYLVEDIKKQL